MILTMCVRVGTKIWPTDNPEVIKVFKDRMIARVSQHEFVIDSSTAAD